MLENLDVHERELDNGLTLKIVQRPGRDVEIEFFLPYGRVDEVPTAHFLEHMAFKSNEFRTAEQLAQDLERNGIKANAHTSSDMMWFDSLAPKTHVETAIEVLYQSLVNEEFDPEEVENVKGELKGELKKRLSRAGSVARQAHDRLLYNNEPPSAEEETPEGIDAIDEEKLVESKRQYFGPSDSVLSIAGDIDPEEAERIVEKYFGRMEEGGSSRHEFEMAPRESKGKEIEVPGSSSVLMVSVPGRGVGHQDYWRLYLLSQVLGGNAGNAGFSNRLFREVRERRGLAYTVFGQMSGKLNGAGVLYSYCGGMEPENTGEARECVVREFERLREEEVPPDELEGAKENLMTNIWRNSYKEVEDLGHTLGMSELYGYEFHFEEIAQKIKDITADDLMSTAQEYFGDYVVLEGYPGD